MLTIHIWVLVFVSYSYDGFYIFMVNVFDLCGSVKKCLDAVGFQAQCVENMKPDYSTLHQSLLN